MKVVLQDIQRLETDALIVGFYEDIRPLKGLAGELDWLLCGALSSLIVNHKLSGALGDLALLTTQGKIPASKIFLLGLGSRQALSPDRLRTAAQTAASSALGAGVISAGFECFTVLSLPLETSLAALRQGVADGIGGHSFDMALLAPDAASYEQISRFIRG